MTMFLRDKKTVLVTFESFTGEAASFGQSFLSNGNPCGEYWQADSIVKECKELGFKVEANQFRGQPLEPFKGGDAVIICVYLPGTFRAEKKARGRSDRGP